MIDSFYVGAYWNSRKETLEEVAEKTVNTLSRLKEIDFQFSTWYELGMSRKKALEKKVSLNSEYIKMLYLKNIKKSEIDNQGYTSHLFSLGLWTGQKDEESSGISFTVGGEFNSNKISNCCVIKLPYEGNSRERLLSLSKAKSLLDILVKEWNPDYALLTSHCLTERLGSISKVGWVTYIKNINADPKIKNKVVSEKWPNGYLFYLNLPYEESYDYSIAKKLMILKGMIE